MQENVNMAAGSPDDGAESPSAICCACRAGLHLYLPADSAREPASRVGFLRRAPWEVAALLTAGF